MMFPLYQAAEPLLCLQQHLLATTPELMFVSFFVACCSLVTRHHIRSVSTNELHMSYLAIQCFRHICIAQVVPTAAQYKHQGMKHKVPQHKVQFKSCQAGLELWPNQDLIRSLSVSILLQRSMKAY